MHVVIELIQQALHVVLHLDLYLNTWITAFGPGIYALLFLVIFAETGLVVTPFLPGDSFLFALGALCAIDNAYLSLPLLMGLLTLAAILGDATNYAIGRRIGPKIFAQNTGRLFNKEHLERAHRFYEKHGGKTIILARFAPIIRTFAPFVAGIAKMHYGRFATYNIVGGVAWVLAFLCLGYFFGNLPEVQSHFHLVIVGIVVLSLLPIAIEFLKAQRQSQKLKVSTEVERGKS